MPLETDAEALLAAKLRAGGLSARGLHKVSRVAQTVATLDGTTSVTFEHVSEALALRGGRAVLAT